jgi:hypothetical protein
MGFGNDQLSEEIKINYGMKQDRDMSHALFNIYLYAAQRELILT